MILIQSANYDLVAVICMQTIEKQMIDGDKCVYNITYAHHKNNTHTHLNILNKLYLCFYICIRKPVSNNNTIYTPFQVIQHRRQPLSWPLA